MRRFVMFLVRKKLGLNLCEEFQFVGQKSDAIYCFSRDVLFKKWHGHVEPSGVSLNWLLNDECVIKRV